MPSETRSAGRRPRIVDLFAGPGGLDVGAAWLGVPATGIEWDLNACRTREAAQLDTVHDDVRRYGPADFPEATVLTGGPPCQTFTVAGVGSGRRSLDDVILQLAEMETAVDARPQADGFADERTGMVLEPMRWAFLALRAAAPFQAIVLEQVPAVLPIWEAFGKVLKRHGYGVAHGVLRAEEFGVPQTRRRAILIARFGDDEVALPTPTHQSYRRGNSDQAALGLQRWVSMGEALGRDADFTVISNYGSGGDPRNRGQRRSDEPSATVTGKIMRNRVCSLEGKPRQLTHPEAGMLQTFPSDYPWQGNDIGQQIGNAIPPRLAVHVLAQALKIPFTTEVLDNAVTAAWATSRRAPIASSAPMTR